MDGAVAEACRPHSPLLLAGIGHTGSQGSSAYSQEVMWAPSRVADVVSREPPAPLDAAGIAAIIAAFADAARLAAAAGLDGVEVDAGAWSLLRQFHSGLTNLRPDGYGEDKLRLTREVLAEVREAIGPDRILALRLACDELAPWGGITPDAAAGQVAALAPALDLLTVIRAGPYATTAYRPDAHTPPATNVELCRAMRAAAAGRVAVVLQGSVVDPEAAEEALADGAADLVEMTRAQIADGRLVAHLRAGHPDRARPCLLCNQTCQVRDNRNPVVTCVGDPRSGHETTDPDPDPPALDPPPGRPVLVVGGGPAGLECARVLAGAGRRVGVAERTGALGGALALVAVGVEPGAPAPHWTDWLAAECTRLGVEVAVGLAVDAGAVRAAQAEGWEVVLATGSRPFPDRYPGGGDDPPVIDALTLLREGAEGRPDGPVVVGDPVGGPIGIGVAEWLAATTGRSVTLVSPDPVAGTLLSRTGDLADANVRLQRARRDQAAARPHHRGRRRLELWPRSKGRRGMDRGDLPPARRPAGRLRPPPARRRPLPGARRPNGPAGGRLCRPPDRPRGRLGRPAGRPGPARGPGVAPADRVGRMSGGGQYRQLFTPLRVGPLTLANRIVFSAHLTNYATEDGRPSEQHAAYYAARAAGGAGLIITEEHSTHPTDWPYEKLIHGFHAEVIPGYRRITDAVHRHGVPILAQINHNGGQASSLYTRLPVWAPSPVPDPLFREVPKAVEPHEIAEIVAGYARVAGHCMAGGFDGVELQCSHSSIVRGFLSPATNHRTDGYGGGLASRARLLVELVAAVRAAIGPAAARGVRSAATSSSRVAPPSRTPSRWPGWSKPPARSTTSTRRSGWPPPAST